LRLLALLDRIRDARPPPPGEPAWASPDLLVFLRSMAERDAHVGQLHVFFDRPLPVGVDRLHAWLTDHPEVALHDPAPGETWTVAIDRWLRSGPLRSALEDLLAAGPEFEEMLAGAEAERAGRIREPEEP
jgi:hypothetical protein